MLYNDLVRINSLDSQIINHLNNLLSLYEERSKLTQIPMQDRAAAKTPTTLQTYERLRKQWEIVGVTVPSLKTLKPILDTALELVTSFMTQAVPVVVHIVLIPPDGILQKAMKHAGAPVIDQQSYQDLNLKPNKAWLCAAVEDPAARLNVENVHNFLHTRMLKENRFDTLETGARLVAAGFLQGVVLAEKGTWSLLIADMVSPQEIPCARLINGTLQFTIDDSAGFLGQNYYYPSIIVKSGSKHASK